MRLKLKFERSNLFLTFYSNIQHALRKIFTNVSLNKKSICQKTFVEIVKCSSKVMDIIDLKTLIMIMAIHLPHHKV